MPWSRDDRFRQRSQTDGIPLLTSSAQCFQLCSVVSCVPPGLSSVSDRNATNGGSTRLHVLFHHHHHRLIPHHRAAQHRALPDSTPAASRCPLSMSLHHCRAATTPAMPATGLSSAGASPFRLPASSSSAQGHLRLSPPAATASATACRRRLLLRCAASSGGGGGSGSDPVLEEQRRRQAELAARIASGEFTVQGPGSAAAHFPPHPPSFFYHWY